MKFTILTACYNKKKFIKDCVSSVSSQGYDNWEHIIVDDCSTDGSYEYLSTIDDERVKVIRNEQRMYCSSTYAIALQHATGDICGVVDGDDILHRKAMGVVLKRYLKHPELGYIYTQHYWCDATLKKSRIGLSRSPKDKSLAEAALAGRHCFSHWRTFRTDLAKKTELFPPGLKVSVDKNLGFSLEEVANGAFLPKPVYFYRYYKGNMSLIQGGNQKATTKRLSRERLEHRKKNNISVYPVIKIK